MKAVILFVSFFLLPELFGQSDSTNNELNHVEKNSCTTKQGVLKISSSLIVADGHGYANSGLGYEIELSEKFSYAGLISMIHQPIFFKEDYVPIGLSLKQQFRTYFFRCRFYVGLQAGINYFTIKDRMTVYTSGSAGGWGGGSYGKKVFINTFSWDGYFLAGFQPRIKSTRLLIDVYGGVGITRSSLSYSGLTEQEEYIYSLGHTSSNYFFGTPGKSTSFPSFFAGLSLGYRFGIKKN